MSSEFYHGYWKRLATLAQAGEDNKDGFYVSLKIRL